MATQQRTADNLARRVTLNDAGTAIPLRDTGDEAESAARGTRRKSVEACYRRLFEVINSGIALHEVAFDAEGRPSDCLFLDVNPAYEAITGLVRSELIGRSVGAVPPTSEAKWFDRLTSVAMNGESREFHDFRSDLDRRYRLTAYCPEGGLVAVVVDDVTAAPDGPWHRGGDGAPRHTLVVNNRPAALSARRLLHLRCEHALQRARRHGRKLAFLLLRTSIPASLQERAGVKADELLLAAIFERLECHLRADELLVRLDRDEFVLLMEDIRLGTDPGVLADRLLSAFQQPFAIGGEERLLIRASIGIAISPDDASDPAVLSRHADSAARRAEAEGGNAFCYHAQWRTAVVRDRMRLESRLWGDLESGRLLQYYRPIADVRSRAIVACEASTRWSEAEQETIDPRDFLQLAEECRLSAALDAWALRTACRQMRSWLDAGRAPTRMALHLSSRGFLQQHLPDLLRRVLADTGLDARCLELLICEEVLEEPFGQAVRVLEQMRQTGVGLSIAHYGRGRSSLTSLKRFPISGLIIDRSLIRDIAVDEEAREVAGALAGIGQALGLTVAVDGVDTPEQLRCLDELGCQQYLGDLVGPPLPSRQFLEHVRLVGQ